MYQNSLINNQNGNWFHTLVYSQVFSSYYQQVNAATVQFRKFGIVPVSSLFSGGFGVLSEDQEFFAESTKTILWL